MELYGSATYCATLTHIGSPIFLPRAGGCLLQRTIDGGTLSDLCGPYPWAGFEDWSSVGADLDALDGAVTATAVISPSTEVDGATLRDQFPDYVADFKTHFMLDLTRHYQASWSRSHVRKFRRHRPDFVVEALEPSRILEARWVELYALLGLRREIRGGAAFTKDGLVAQLHLPGVALFGARVGDRIVGMVSFIRSGSVAAYHLGAYDDMGYEFEAAYAIFPVAFEELANAGVGLVNLGGGAGIEVSDDDGLARFKRGWSTHTGVAQIGGRVLQRAVFDRLAGASDARFWPPYRARSPV